MDPDLPVLIWKVFLPLQNLGHHALIFLCPHLLRMGANRMGLLSWHVNCQTVFLSLNRRNSFHLTFHQGWKLVALSWKIDSLIRLKQRKMWNNLINTMWPRMYVESSRLIPWTTLSAQRAQFLCFRARSAQSNQSKQRQERQSGETRQCLNIVEAWKPRLWARQSMYIYIYTSKQKNAPMYVWTHTCSICAWMLVYTQTAFRLTLMSKQFLITSDSFTPFHTVSPCASFAAGFRQPGASLGWLMPAVKPCRLISNPVTPIRRPPMHKITGAKQFWLCQVASEKATCLYKYVCARLYFLYNNCTCTYICMNMSMDINMDKYIYICTLYYIYMVCAGLYFL